MKHRLLILSALLLGACSSPAPTPVVPASEPAPSIAPTSNAPAASARMLEGVVRAPIQYQAAKSVLGVRDAQSPLAGVEVYVTDEAGNELGLSAVTDAQGHYSITLPADWPPRVIVVRARVADRDGRSVTLQSISITGANSDGLRVDVDMVTSLVSVKYLKAGLPGGLSNDTFTRAVMVLEGKLTLDVLASFDLTDDSKVVDRLGQMADADTDLAQALGIATGSGSATPRPRGRSGSNNQPDPKTEPPTQPAIIFSGQVQ